MATSINKPLDIEKAPIELKPGQRILATGAIYDSNVGRIVGKAAPNPWAITSEKSNEYRQQRKKKAEALLRSRIIEAHNAAMPNQVISGAGAFADAGAMLYEEIVLNSDKYPRDRLEAWNTLGKAAGVLADPREPGASDGGMQGASDILAGVNKLVELLRDTIQQPKAQLHDTIEGEVRDSE
jgi:hypothetical protein